MRSPAFFSATLLSTLFSCAAVLAATEPTPPVEQLDSVNVTTEAYQPVQPDVPASGLKLLGLELGPPPDWPVRLGPYVVTASRLAQVPERVAASAFTLDAGSLQRQPTVTTDAALRSVPGFSLFRRSDSLTANPTAQGVSLRGLGPSGASRSLVLLDGIPLNDPFGGWVNWSQLQRDLIARIEIVPGGGATAWGNAALGGVMQVFLHPPRTETLVVDRPPAPMSWAQRGTAEFSAWAGDFETRAVAAVLNHPVPRGIVQLLAENFSTGGFRTVAPERRGAIDVPAWTRHRSGSLTWRHSLAAQAELSVFVRGFDETRGNGTPYQRNATRATVAGVQVAAQPSETVAWNAAAYVQDQVFSSTFSAVNATRTAETPASDQYAVPATAGGLSWTGAWTHPSGAVTGVGVDARTVRGETREFYSYAAGEFTRERAAGGRQAFAGVFVSQQRPLHPGLRATYGWRVDGWRDEAGRRRERIRATGAVTREDEYAPSDDVELSPNLGVVWTPAPAWRVRAHAQRAFRRPTLNELYRPFRQGANVTEANAALKTEHVTSAEIGLEWRRPGPVLRHPKGLAPVREEGGASAPSPGAASGAVTLFWNELDDAVANVTVARGPGTFPLFGTLPAGGVGRQRLNLEQLRVRGVEASGTWTPLANVQLSGAFLYSDATVRSAAIAPHLVGRRLAQVPRVSGTLGATWRAPAGFVVTPQLRWMGGQFEDDENALRLGEVVVVNLGVTRAFGERLEFFATVENVTDARIETGRSVEGVVNVGTPRFFVGGLRARF